jgi:26S proteasome non-ATPase regulatory subunit 9
MSRIEKGLHEHHARMAEQAQTDPEGARRAQSAFEAAPAALEAPFAKVNSVVAGSPAETAGLKVGDTITKFGWVDWTNHERLSRVAEAVSQNEGVSASLVSRSPNQLYEYYRQHANSAQLPIAVKALRPSTSGGPAETVQMTLIPTRNWGGRGMLGCHLLPL